MHFRLFGIPLEFVNFVLALIAYSIAYPAVSFGLWLKKKKIKVIEYGIRIKRF